MFVVLKVLGVVAGLYILYIIIWKILRLKFRLNCPPLLGPFLDSNLRRRFQPAERLIFRSGIMPGMTVLEIGCGSGPFTTTAAQRVGPRGRVYAIDIQPGMLRLLEEKLGWPEYADLKNITVQQADAHKLPFADGMFDVVFMVTVLPEIPDKAAVLNEIKRVLKFDGILAVSENIFFDPDWPLPSQTVRTGWKAGFTLEDCPGSSFNYTARFRKEEYIAKLLESEDLRRNLRQRHSHRRKNPQHQHPDAVDGQSQP